MATAVRIMTRGRRHPDLTALKHVCRLRMRGGLLNHMIRVQRVRKPCRNQHGCLQRRQATDTVCGRSTLEDGLGGKLSRPWLGVFAAVSSAYKVLPECHAAAALPCLESPAPAVSDSCDLIQLLSCLPTRTQAAYFICFRPYRRSQQPPKVPSMTSIRRISGISSWSSKTMLQILFREAWEASHQ